MKYVSLIINGDIVNQIAVLDAPLSLEEIIIELDAMLRKEDIIDEDMEIAVTEEV